MLINTFGNEKEINEREILNFVLTSMSSIYQEPHAPVKESKVAFGVDGKIASFKADFSKTMEDTKKALVKTVKEEIEKTADENLTK